MIELYTDAAAAHPASTTGAKTVASAANPAASFPTSTLASTAFASPSKRWGTPRIAIAFVGAARELRLPFVANAIRSSYPTSADIFMLISLSDRS